ncbi:nuclear RNA export factor 1/2 [Pseudohyphozyma bogoriensis]|nr:nuclear RNA export factor 1/2 [Pseudohyphozyma bogoriensis]
MSTPAAAKLLAQALAPRSDPTGMATDPPVPGPSTSSTNSSPGVRGRGSARGRGRGGRGGPGRATDEDVGMSDLSDSGAKRRGRQTARRGGGPMGERPSKDKPYDSKRSHNTPAIIREDKDRAKSSPASTSNITASGPASAGAIDTLRVFLQARYDPGSRMLNLENMAGDTILNNAGLKAPGEKGAPSSVAGALWKLASEMFPDVISLSLANNKLTSVLPLSPYLLTTSLPNIQNVSFASNSLARIRDLDPFSPSIGKPRGDGKQKGWAKLQELVMTGNPLVGTGDAEASYRSEVARRFPALRQLDQTPLDPSIAFAAAASAPPTATPGLSNAAKREAAKSKQPPVAFPKEVRGGFIESDGVGGVVGPFLEKFFKAYDEDRPSLALAYAPICSFSFSADTQPPLRSRAKKIGNHGDKKFPNQHKLEWTQYLSSGRNLQRVQGAGKRVTNLQLSPDKVIAALTSLPGTIHPLSDASKFVFDTWTMPGLLAPVTPGAPPETAIYATVHGEFTELPSKGVRSFDRTFVLAPVPPGSPAQLAGWTCLILSDLFTIRGYSDPIAWAPKPAPTAAAPVAGGPPVPAPAGGPVVAGVVPGQERADGLTDQQQALVVELQKVTRLTYTFAHMCLVQNGWDPTTALANFQGLQATGAIPPEAFMP